VAFLGAIPMDPAVREGGDLGLPVILSKPESPVALALRALTENVAARISVAAVQQNNFIPINVIG
jgi:ATP-binding protein involved in chromosome partitioning